MASRHPIRIGTRGSPLALAQANEVRERLRDAHPRLAATDAVEIVPIKTTGDQVTDRPLAEIGGKGLFTQEIEAALQGGRIHMAVHSMKDVPTWLPEGLVIGAVLPREDPRDALIAEVDSISALPAGATVGTSSLRRQAQLLAQRPDLSVTGLRGNVATRLRKVAEGQVAATFLAVAGLRRLGLVDSIAAVLPPEEMLPAVAQGAIGIEMQAEDDETGRLIAAINDAATEARVRTERGLLDGLRGSCTTPVGVYAELDDAGEIWLRALLAAPDGGSVFRAERRGPVADGLAMAKEAAAELRAQAGPALCRQLGLDEG
ncbi:MAG: hydroxymethylbilane synthase [Alphaproteobacteria bacterium]|nr:hydroxymethylbilane synthase [Alphaproteobacteria bacterium]